MGLLEDAKALGLRLPDSLKPVYADLVDIVAGLVQAIEDSGVLPAKQVQGAQADNTVGSVVADITPGQPPPVVEPAAVEAPAEPAAPPEPETVGSLVADITPGPPPAPDADPLATFTVQQLTDELAKRQSEAVATADANKSTVGPLEAA